MITGTGRNNNVAGIGGRISAATIGTWHRHDASSNMTARITPIDGLSPAISIASGILKMISAKTVKPLITDADKALWMIKEAFMRLRLNI